MINIKLSKCEWVYDPERPLGKAGGFGQVFVGSGEGYDQVAVKRLKLEASDLAHRELRIADDLISRELQYVIRVLDYGCDAESDVYYIVMDMAEKCLQDEIEEKGTIEENQLILILKDIAQGLKEVNDIVYRDLKPQNVLRHSEKWKLADFGIARFVEDSTSTRTLKECLSAYYAAPEQWREEHATNATDIYALGCIGYTLITGNPPFSGASREEIRDKHLHQTPARLSQSSRKLASLLSMMLRKEPSVRPSIDRIISILEDILAVQDSPNKRIGSNLLAKVGALESDKSAQIEAEQIRAREALKKRGLQSKEAFEILIKVVNELFSDIVKEAPTAYRSSSERNPSIRLGHGKLEINMVSIGSPIDKDAFKRCGWDVIAGAFIRVSQDSPAIVYHRSASLWFTNRGVGENYRWWEVCYMALMTGQMNVPFYLSSFKDADYAASNVTHIYQLAATPRTIDDEDAESFKDRWMHLFAQASEGQMQRPSRLPLLE